MSSRSYNHYHPNAQPDSLTSGHHSQGSKGSHRSHPLPFPAHGSLSGPPPGDGTGRCHRPPTSLPSPAHGPSRSGQPLPNDGTGRHYPPGYQGSQSGSHLPDDGTGRYPPGYPPQNTVSHQVDTPRRQDLSWSTPYNNPYITPHGPSHSGPLLPDPPNPPPYPGPSKPEQSGPPPPGGGGGGTRRRLLSMIKYVSEFFL
jgi:hypothetical protein